MIRQAKISDADKLLKLWDLGYKDTPFSDMQYDRLHVQRVFAAVCTFEEKFFCKVVEEDGELLGILIGAVDKNFWGVPVSQTIISYSLKESDKLIRQFTQWSQSKGAKMVTIHTVEGKPRYEAMVSKLGFSNVGGVYTKEL